MSPQLPPSVHGGAPTRQSAGGSAVCTACGVRLQASWSDAANCAAKVGAALRRHQHHHRCLPWLHRPTQTNAPNVGNFQHQTPLRPRLCRDGGDLRGGVRSRYAAMNARYTCHHRHHRMWQPHPLPRCARLEHHRPRSPPSRLPQRARLGRLVARRAAREGVAASGSGWRAAREQQLRRRCRHPRRE